MGTRADFYAGGTDPATMEWLGSIAWDGDPTGIAYDVLNAESEGDWADAVAAFLGERDDATLPVQGWPWPWADSTTTDYAYTWTPEGVRCSYFGQPWLPTTTDHEPPEPGTPKAQFPDMTAVQNIAWDNRSGLIILRGGADADDPDRPG